MEANNVKEMREALRQVSRVAVEMTRKTVTGESEDRNTVDEWALRLCDIVSATLAAQPRNCDVGTADEQSERFYSFCKRFQSGIQGMCSPQCPCKECSDMCHCQTKWLQMPYEEAKGETK